jgi:hypothetical protein
VAQDVGPKFKPQYSKKKKKKSGGGKRKGGRGERREVYEE